MDHLRKGAGLAIIRPKNPGGKFPFLPDSIPEPSGSTGSEAPSGRLPGGLPNRKTSGFGVPPRRSGRPMVDPPVHHVHGEGRFRGVLGPGGIIRKYPPGLRRRLRASQRPFWGGGSAAGVRGVDSLQAFLRPSGSDMSWDRRKEDSQEGSQSRPDDGPPRLRRPEPLLHEEYEQTGVALPAWPGRGRRIPGLRGRDGRGSRAGWLRRVGRLAGFPRLRRRRPDSPPRGAR